MKLTNYFRQLKKIINSRKNLKKQGIKKKYYYLYNRKIFFSFLIFGLFKESIQIKFGSDYWKHVKKYYFHYLPRYFKDYMNYIFKTSKYRQIYFSKPISPILPSQKKGPRYIRELVLKDIANSCGFKIIDVKFSSFKRRYTLKTLSD